MLRQSLKLFIKNMLPTSRTQAALQKLEENEFHKRLRNELIMLPIPKAKYFRHKVPVGVNPIDVEDEIIEKQKHSVLNAINRVSLDSPETFFQFLKYVVSASMRCVKLHSYCVITVFYIFSWYFNRQWTQLVSPC